MGHMDRYHRPLVGALIALLVALAASPALAARPQDEAPRMQTGSFSSKEISLELNKVELRELLRFLRVRYGFSFVIDRSVPASVPVTCSITRVPWDEALRVILASQGLIVVQDGPIARITAL